MSTGLKGPPLVRVSGAPVISSVIDSHMGPNINTGKFTHIRNDGTPETQTVSKTLNDEAILSNAMGASAIVNDLSPIAKPSAPIASYYSTSSNSVSSVPSRSVVGMSNNFNDIGGPPPPIHTNNLQRFSSNQPPHTGQFGGPPPPPSYRTHLPNDIPRHALVPNDIPRTHAPPHAPPRSAVSPQPTAPVAPPKRTGRIDSSQIPRPPRPQKDIVYNTRSGTGWKVPPLSGAIFKAVDNGNCSPRLMRVTMCAVPTNKEVLGNTGIPMAMVVTPFAGPENGEEPVQLVDMGESPPRYIILCLAFIFIRFYILFFYIDNSPHTFQ